MRISDWSSDVCSSDLIGKAAAEQPGEGDAKGELVGLLIAPVPLVNLGSHIARRTWIIGSGRVFDARQPRHAEIDQPQPAVLGDDDVFRLYVAMDDPQPVQRSEEHTSELQSLMRISYAVFCLKKKKTKTITSIYI